MGRVGWRPRFTIRAVLWLTLLLAMGLAWRWSLERAEMQMALHANQLKYAEEELGRTRDEIDDQRRPKRDRSRIFYAAVMDGTQFEGVTIISQSNAFQRASLKECDLKDATLQGGDAAFQLARFDRAKLVNAKLSGGNASFQHASFVEADLTGAVLTGTGSSFQRSSFEKANLTRARLAGSFQSVNISGAHFEGADLSALDSADLASCYFKEAPSYDGGTKFPAGFDPVVQLWRRVSE